MRRSTFVATSLSVCIVAAVPARQSARATPIFTCGTNQTIAEPIPLTAAAVILAADGRLYAPCGDPANAPDDRAARERDVLMRATQSSDATIRRLAARSLGQVQRTDGPVIETLLATLTRDASPLVRREAADAIGEVFAAQRGDFGGSPLTLTEAQSVTVAGDVLFRLIDREPDDGVAAAMAETLGRLRYLDDQSRTVAEGRLMTLAQRSPVRQLGAAKGLEALVRQNARRPLAEATRDWLRQTVASGPTGAVPAAGSGAERDDPVAVAARTRRLALATLVAAGGDETATVVRAARDADWQVRRLAAPRMDWTRTDLQPTAAALLDDPVFQVRYEALVPLARSVGRATVCAPLVGRLADPEPTIVLRALDLIPAACPDAAAVAARLTTLADALANRESATRWHVPARALAALARVQPEAARTRLARAAAHATWQVRATAAAVAAQINDPATARRLADDRVANVRTAALEALSRMRSADLPAAAVSALSSPDHQLVRTAATVLRGLAADRRPAAADALLAALTRLTGTASDTSRDPRVAILERLGEVLAAASASRLNPWLADFDPRVRAAAAAAIKTLTGADATSAVGVRRRYPAQPALTELTQLPASATIRMADGGRIELDLLGSEAPVTVARFAALARAGYYDGLTFHRIVPNFVVQGGSPGANEYVGADRYWRDEVGLASNLRGTVGVSTRGRDTGDGQIFINLVDSPRLDHSYTVFARVRSGLDVVDRLLEGATMARITVR